MKGWFMALILAIVVVAMLRNAAGATGIILAGGDVLKSETGALTGSVATKGTFSTGGGTKIQLG